MQTESIVFSSFIAFIVGVLLLDLGVFNKKHHKISFREASIWSGVWVCFALLFFLFLKTNGELIHGIKNFADFDRVLESYVDDKEAILVDRNNFETTIQSYRDSIAIEFITGYLLEYSLSVDNIFVIILIFTSFRVREKYFKKVLFWGILGAIVMRFIFIFAGAALIHNFHSILYIFGGILIYSGIKMFFDDADGKIEPEKHPIVRLVSKYFRVFPRYLQDRFFIRKNGQLYLTPLFVVVVIVEFTDLLFAVDSVPAVFAVTQDPYIVFFSNIFAIMGLRSMFFFLSNVMHIFHYLKIGLAVLLIFIGLKMITYEWLLKPIGFKTHYSLVIILFILVTSVVFSLLFPVKKTAKNVEEVELES